MYGLNSGWVAIGLYHLGIVAGVVASRTSWSRIRAGFVVRPAIGLWLLGVCAAPAVAIGLPLLVFSTAGEVREDLVEGLGRLGMGGAVSFWLFVAYLSLPHPGLEELGWREVLGVESRRPHLRDLEFASYHLLVLHYFFPFQWLLFAWSVLCLAGLSWAWRLLRQRYGGLAVPSWFHAGGDLGVMLGIWWLIR